jgi:DNA-binding response OmpR family regulator
MLSGRAPTATGTFARREQVFRAAGDEMAEEVRVVVVDDLVDAAESLAALLTLDGYRVRTAHDGAEAWALIEAFDPICVLFDIKMPGIDGAELSRRLRAKFGNDIVLIAVTGAPEEDEQVEQTFARVDYYLHKPVNLARLRQALPPVR